MLLGLFYAFLSALFFGISNVIMKHMTLRINKISVMVVRSSFTLLALLPFLFFAEFIIPPVKQGIIILIIGIIGAVAYYYFVKAIELTDVSVISALSRISAVITVLLSVFLLGEELQAVQYVAIVLVLSGIMFLTIDLKRLSAEQLLKEKKSLRICFFVVILWGWMYFLLKYSVNSVGVFYTAFYLEFFVFFFIALLLLRKENFLPFRRDISLLVDRKKYLAALAVMGALTAFGSLFYSFAISLIYVSFAIIINNLSPLVTAIIARIFINERLSVNKIIAIFITVAGVVLLTI